MKRYIVQVLQRVAVEIDETKVEARSPFIAACDMLNEEGVKTALIHSTLEAEREVFDTESESFNSWVDSLA